MLMAIVSISDVIGYDVKIIDLFALFDDEENFSKLSDEDAIRLCLLLSLENSFPWGEHIWRQLYDSIRNVSSKHKLEHLVGLKRNPNHVLSYSLSGFLFAFKAPIELAPTKDEVQCNWYAPSNDNFMWYVPRSPPVSIGGLYGEYMNKRSAARTAKKKSSEDFHPSECVREASLIDRVCNLECICETLLTLPKEVKSLRGRIHKLESIIQSTFYPSRVVEKQETLKKVVPQIEDYLQSTSEDESDIKDHTSPKQDDGNVYCCDDNGDVPLFFMPTKPHYKYTYSSKQEDQIILLVDQRQQDHISNMTEVSEQRIQSEIQRLYNHREARLNKIVEEDKQRKFLGHMNSSAHMKLAIERCVPKKRKYVDVLRSPFCALPKISNVPSIEQLANQRIRAVVGRCKFPWCNDITVDRSFWNGLCALDDNRKGWLLDEVFIPINKPLRHGSLAMFHICSGVVTFYNSERTEGGEYHKWYLQMRDCLEEKIHVVLKGTGVLANGIPLALDDPLQSALVYQEKLIHFYFKHKMLCP
ncbi:hypothetical protein Tco_0717033 [Tanacetum coccineum]